MEYGVPCVFIGREIGQHFMEALHLSQHPTVITTSSFFEDASIVQRRIQGQDGDRSDLASLKGVVTLDFSTLERMYAQQYGSESERGATWKET
ncbi:hypothetical protein G7K_3743-t1 [Saitoella complicata NRRL Y-17804]|uniref:Uncharacterized protein n=1 Tax=Saitoella complicata (strain BCRC 22490 / CBS 7301 / JCM 7358 / NBRC 10748 / NRRL Y-17804) TaxID=698492 RepID=A0A0E9NIC0_SAICN|nr:hypothetical protein G7K_3743-t1 [Saitoella complicata NRRL Y-17804]